MRWQGFASFKYYASVAVALVGLSAASTLLTDRVSLAQQPTVETTVTVSDEGTDKLELAEKILAETLGDNHPKLKEVRARLDQARMDQARAQARMEQARDQARKASQAAGKAEAARRVVVQSVNGSPVTVTDEVSGDSDVVTENVVGNQSVVLRRTADGKEVREVLALAPKEMRAFSVFGNAKQNSELQKAIELYTDKDATGKDKLEAKEKIVNLLGKQFDDDMEQRAKQVAELEKKLSTLKDQMVKRKEAKQRIIDLRIEVLMNETEGLGFPSSPQGVFGPALFNAVGPSTTYRALSLPGTQIAPVPPVPPAAPAAPVPEK